MYHLVQYLLCTYKSHFQLVGGPFDMESKFIIQRASSVDRLVELIDNCNSDLQVI